MNHYINPMFAVLTLNCTSSMMSLLCHQSEWESCKQNKISQECASCAEKKPSVALSLPQNSPEASLAFLCLPPKLSIKSGLTFTLYRRARIVGSEKRGRGKRLETEFAACDCCRPFFVKLALVSPIVLRRATVWGGAGLWYFWRSSSGPRR